LKCLEQDTRWPVLSMKTRPVLKRTRRSEWECVIETPRRYRDKRRVWNRPPSTPRGRHFFRDIA
jgi:hypothetical protein